jgi:outer membrane protein
MKRLFALLLMMASAAGIGAAAQTLPLPDAPSTAPAPAPVAPAKIAVIAFQAVVAQTNEGQRNFGELQKKFEPKRAALKTLNGEIESLTKQLQAQGDKLSETEKANRAKTIDEKKKKLEREGEDAQNDFNQEMQEVYNKLASKVYDVLAAYVQQQGYTLALDVASQQQNPILWATPSTDISQAVVNAYNAKSGVPAPASSAAPKPAARPAAKPAAKSAGK